MRQMFCLIPTNHYGLFLAWVSSSVSALVVGDALCFVDAGLRQKSSSWLAEREQRNHHRSVDLPVVSFVPEKSPPALNKGAHV